MKPLSVIIITYNRPDDLLMLLRNIAEQHQAAALLDNVVIIDNASSADYSSVQSFIAAHPGIPFQYIRSEENLGVARGRNKALEYARAPFIITIDDDAYFKETDALLKIRDLFDSPFARENQVGAFCFKVLYGSTGTLQQTAFPHKNIAKYKDKSRFLTYYYIGCGHAIRRDVYDAAGNYPTDFFYGMEEYDLGYRILNKGYHIAYDDSVVIIHNESPYGRTPHLEKMKMMWINKSKVAYRYLPFIYFLSTALMWSIEFLKKTSWNWNAWSGGWKLVRKIPAVDKRSVVNKETRRYLEQVEARLWY